MTLLEHLSEFRSRLLKSVLAIVVMTIVGWIFYDQIFTFLAKPLEDVVAQQKASGLDIRLVFTGISDPFNLKLKISFFAGLLFASPVWLWQLWRFVTPGLHKHERRYAIAFVAAAVPLFTAGVALGYFVLPGVLNFMLGFTPVGASNFPRVDEYLTFELKFLALLGAGFLTPLLLLLLNVIGLLSGKRMLRWWRWIIITTLIIAGLCTPNGDPVTMSLIAAPLLALIFGAVGLALLNDKRRARLNPEPDYSKMSDDEASPIADAMPVEPADPLDDGATR
jgi:sec-independent protein translocase protein TatC